MLTARAATNKTVSADMTDSNIISIFAVRLSGITSVGLNAMALVNDT
jgi:hypothetical protein